MNRLLLDVRYGLRHLQKDTKFVAAVVATLALAIGVSTAAFTVFNAVLVRPLPYHNPERVVVIKAAYSQGYASPATYAEYLDWRQGNHSFSALAGYSVRSATFEGAGGSVVLQYVAATDNFFDVFEVKPLIGRTFVRGEDQPGKNDLAVLSYEVWRRDFGAQPSVLGTVIRLDARPYTVIGVMPAGFRFPLYLRFAVYTPLHLTPEEEHGGGHWLPTVARLKSGISVSQAQDDMTILLAGLISQHRTDPGRRISLAGAAQYFTGSLVSPLRMLLVGAFSLLAIGCTNIASLLIVRGVIREHEITLRIAIGATRGQVLQQLLIEALLLGLASGIAGAALAWTLLDAIRPLLLDSLPLAASVQVDSVALLVAVGSGLVAMLLASLLPAVRVSGNPRVLAPTSQARVGTTRAARTLREGFVLGQVSLAFMLLTTAGAALRGLTTLQNTSLGFDPDKILTTEITLAPASQSRRDIMAAFYEPLLSRVRRIPGVSDVGLIQVLPIRTWGFTAPIHVRGTPPDPPDRRKLAAIRLVTPGYFRTMGIPLLRGRMLDERTDTPDSAAILVNEAFVRQFLPDGEDPIGKQLDGSMTIAGVVGAIRQSLYTPPFPEINYLTSQLDPKDNFKRLATMQLVIRSTQKAAVISPSLQRAYRDVDPAVAFQSPQTMRDVVSGVLAFDRLKTWLFGSYALLGFVLALVGLYGLINYQVTSSTREVGIRLALGASRLRLLAGVLAKVGSLLVAGVLAGGLLLYLLKPLWATVVTIHGGRDAALIACIGGGFVVIGCLAAYIPTRRAAWLDPSVALRHE
jgi:putative ABC transport system permease protein